jgi:protein-S-isoprenylcysteine O-methyltransferase Ste14
LVEIVIETERFKGYMSEIVYDSLFIIYAVLLGLLRLPQHIKYGRKKGRRARVSNSEKWTFSLAFIGMLAVPLVHIFTGWLDAFSMGLPHWARLCGPVAASLGLLFLWWVHKTLGYHWAPISELSEEHKLLREGPYKYIRHPMYAAFYLIFIGAWLNLSNWAVTIIGILSWYLFCSVRIKAEEEMMVKEFGREYEEYTKKTGRFLPKLIKQP